MPKRGYIMSYRRGFRAHHNLIGSMRTKGLARNSETFEIRGPMRRTRGTGCKPGATLLLRRADTLPIGWSSPSTQTP